ncbi:MAG: hypothetical protein ABI644_04220 [Arenimonas sp.]
MNNIDDPESIESLDAKRDVLRQRMQAQRELIAIKLGPDKPDGSSFPRSNTMRFFYDRPGLASKLALEFASVLVGARIIKSMGKTIGLAKIVQAALNK